MEVHRARLLSFNTLVFGFVYKYIIIIFFVVAVAVDVVILFRLQLN